MSRHGATYRSRALDVDGLHEMPARDYAYHAQRCAGKSWFDSRREARRAAKRASKAEGKRFKAYRCGICDKWHLTTHPW